MIGGAVVRQRQMCCQDAAKDQESILDKMHVWNLLNYTLVLFMDYSYEASIIDLIRSGYITTIDIGGQQVFYPGIWGTV